MTTTAIITRLEELGFTVSRQYTDPREPYQDYTLTKRRGDRPYDIGTLTVYRDGGPCLVLWHHNVNRLEFTRKAQNIILDVLGYSSSRYDRDRGRAYAMDQHPQNERD